LCIGNETGEPGRAGVDAVVYLDGPSFFAVRRAFGGTLSSAASLAYVDAAIKTKQSPMILVNSEGRPWTPDGFRQIIYGAVIILMMLLYGRGRRVQS
jgi:hypothetical protein